MTEADGDAENGRGIFLMRAMVDELSAAVTSPTRSSTEYNVLMCSRNESAVNRAPVRSARTKGGLSLRLFSCRASLSTRGDTRASA